MGSGKGFGISAAEWRVIKKVAVYSTAGCIALVLAAWSMQKYLIRRQGTGLEKIVTDGGMDLSVKELLPIDMEAHQYVAQRMLASGQPSEAIPHLLRILSSQKKNRRIRTLLGDAYLESGFYDKALREYSLLLEESVEDSLTSRITARKGIALFYLQQLDESTTILKACLAKYGTMAEAACFMGQIEASFSNESKQALMYLNQALAWDSTYVEGWYQLGRYYMNLKNYAQARLALLRALEIDPLHVKSHSRLGMLYFYNKNYDLSENSYQTALALNPQDYNTRYNLGELYYTYSDFQSALAQYKLALQRFPEHAEANFKAGLICMKNDMIKEGVRYLKQAHESDPKSVRNLLQLAVAYERLGDREQALQVYRTVQELDALNSVALQKIKFLTSGNVYE
jgi:protein O-GlcNAc transferase